MESLFASKEDFEQMIQAWKSIANDKEGRKLLKSYHYILYSMLRRKNPRRGFTPCTNPRKLDAGHNPNEAFDKARATILNKYWPTSDLLSPFGNTVTEDMLKQIRLLLEQEGV